eukprot:scaffold4011_cov128-Skeletonema_marinoi.AAC.3
MTPKATADNATPSSSSSVATVSPIIANNVAIAHMNDAKMPPSLPLSSHSRPSNNHSSNNNIKLGTSKILAANFSESYEAFSRLTNKFWPGPMIIYAPARMIRVGNTTTGCTDLLTLQKSSHNNWPRSSSTESSSSSSSCPSLPSFTNLYSLEKGEGAAGNNMDSQEVPVLPPSILIPLRDLLPGENNNTNNEEQFFIGMQCPSHPLARKILTEIYRPRRGSITSTSASSVPMTHSTSTESFASFSSLDTSITFPHCRQGKQQHVRCGVAVVGSYVAPLLTGGPSSSSGGSSTTVVANSATNVTKILSSSASSNNSNVNRAAEQIYIVNGEDTTHENFSVPTCNYGGVSPISLVVDGDNRTIHLLRHHQNGHNVVSGGCKNIHKDKIYRALLQPPSSLRSTTAANVNNCSNKKTSSTREIDRVITAVLSRWKVVEHHV